MCETVLRFHCVADRIRLRKRISASFSCSAVIVGRVKEAEEDVENVVVFISDSSSAIPSAAAAAVAVVADTSAATRWYLSRTGSVVCGV